MPGLSEKLLLWFALTAVAAGCKPKIGDDCKISTDCSAAGDRLCDITAPGGYCTVFNCEPGGCPEDESLCVEFGAKRSPLCAAEPSPSPYARTFCMATCDDDSDCRSGYTCQDLSKQNSWGAVLIDTDRGNKACLVPFSGGQLDPEAMQTDVCQVQPASGSDDGASGGSPGG